MIVAHSAVVRGYALREQDDRPPDLSARLREVADAIRCEHLSAEPGDRLAIARVEVVADVLLLVEITRERRRVPASALADAVAEEVRAMEAEGLEVDRRVRRRVRDRVEGELLLRALPDRRRHAAWLTYDGTILVQGLDADRADMVAREIARAVRGVGGPARELAEVPEEAIDRLTTDARAETGPWRLDYDAPVSVRDERGVVRVRDETDGEGSARLLDAELAPGRRIVGARLERGPYATVLSADAAPRIAVPRREPVYAVQVADAIRGVYDAENAASAALEVTAAWREVRDAVWTAAHAAGVDDARLAAIRRPVGGAQADLVQAIGEAAA